MQDVLVQLPLIELLYQKIVSPGTLHLATDSDEDYAIHMQQVMLKSTFINSHPNDFAKVRSPFRPTITKI